MFYQRLKKSPTTTASEQEVAVVLEEDVVKRSNSSSSSSSSGLSFWRSRRRPRVRVSGLRRLMKRKASTVESTVMKMLRIFKEGRPYLGEIFAGNYLFMQVAPSAWNNSTSSKYSDKYAFLWDGAHYQAVLKQNPL